jgi:hypothetical protein
MWAQVVILAVLLLPALIRVVEALRKAFLPRNPRPSYPRPFYHELGSSQQHVLRQQSHRKVARSARDGFMI